MKTQAQAQAEYDERIARMFPPHSDPEDSFSRAYAMAKEFRRQHLANALEHHDPRRIDAVGHAADRFIEAMQAAIGATERPAKARFVPEAVS